MLPMKERPTSFICVSETRMCRCQFLKRDVHEQVCAMCVLRVSITAETQLIPESHQPAVTTQPPRQDTWACSAGLPPTPNLYSVVQNFLCMEMFYTTAVHVAATSHRWTLTT